MDEKTKLYEDELIEALAESFSIAVELLDAETIIRCIKASIASDKEHYRTVLDKYEAIDNSIKIN